MEQQKEGIRQEFMLLNLPNPVNLVEHLRRSQAPHESADCGRAEAAAHPAADLG